MLFSFIYQMIPLKKFQAANQIKKSKLVPRIIYEDENILLINKPVGVLSHSANKEYGNNIVDSMIHYLTIKEEYNPRVEKTFKPSICNRLDRNTSGIIIGAKNYEALRIVNSAIKRGDVHKYYKTIVKRRVKEEGIIEGYLSKDEELNKVRVLDDNEGNAKRILTKSQSVEANDKYSCLK